MIIATWEEFKKEMLSICRTHGDVNCKYFHTGKVIIRGRMRVLSK